MSTQGANFMWHAIQEIFMLIGMVTVWTLLSQRVSQWFEKREYKNSRDESNGHVTFSEWKQERERERKAQGSKQPHEAGKRQPSHSMGMNELTLREEYNSLVKRNWLTESKVPLPPWSYWLQDQLDKRGMTLFDLDPQVQQIAAREEGREKEWLEARDAARRAHK
jgi:hypothetical protein